MFKLYSLCLNVTYVNVIIEVFVELCTGWILTYLIKEFSDNNTFLSFKLFIVFWEFTVRFLVCCIFNYSVFDGFYRYKLFIMHFSVKCAV